MSMETGPGETRPVRQIRAVFDEQKVRVYQAYRREIAVAALHAQTFVAPFKRGRMTWIKPSFLWMMYRCGWATKPGQEHVLGIDIRREGFEWALANACLSSFDHRAFPSKDAWQDRLKAAPVRVQWDPERSITLQPQPFRSIQIGLSADAVRRYLDDWIVAIEDVTERVQQIREIVRRGDIEAASHLLPREAPYPLPDHLAAPAGIIVNRLNEQGEEPTSEV